MRTKFVGEVLCAAILWGFLLGSGPGAWAAGAPTAKPAPASAPVKKIQVPKVVGMTRSTAWTTLTAVGLKPVQGKVVQAKSPVQNETVAAQNPSFGQMGGVAPGSVVTLDMYFFDGVIVPNVVGMLTNKAQKTITNAGLRWQLRRQVIVTDPKIVSLVAAQDPPAGTQVKKGTLVHGDWNHIVTWRPK